jgi:prenyltransferase beta subunit
MKTRNLFKWAFHRARARARVTCTVFALLGAPVALAEDPVAEAQPDAAQLARVEAAVDRALQYLATVQNEEGSFPQGVNPVGPNNGVNGVCLLAYLGRGHTPSRGPYRQVVNRAIRYILSTQTETGLYASKGPSHGVMYEHALATLSMVESYGSVPSLEMRRSVQRAVDLIVKAQTPEGGWRYTPNPTDADLSVTVMQVVALHAAQNARLNVPQATVDKAAAYVKKCIVPSGGFTYQPGGAPTCAQTAAGSLCLQLLGDFQNPAVLKALQFLQAREFNGNIDPYFYYTTYYAMQSHFQAGDQQWATWHPRVRKFLLENQNEDGSWPGFGEEKFNGPVAKCYSTAMATMCLEVYMHFLPAYQR